MEIIAGSLIALSGVILTLVWVPVVRCILYPFMTDENLEELQRVMSHLQDIKADVQRILAGPEASRRVKGWLERVEAFERNAQLIEEDEFHGSSIKCDPRSCCSSCMLSKKALKMRKRAKEFFDEGLALELPQSSSNTRPPLPLLPLSSKVQPTQATE